MELVADILGQYIQPLHVLVHILDRVILVILRLLDRPRLLAASSGLRHRHVHVHALQDAIFDDLRRHKLPAAHAVFEAWPRLARDHVLLVADELEEGLPDIIQPHAVPALRHSVSANHLGDLLHQSQLVGSVRLHLCVGIHQDCEQNVEQDHEQDDHEGPKPYCTRQQPDLLHLGVVPIAKERPEGCDDGAWERAKRLVVLAEDDDCVD
mmetsp:Transcript_11087/g.27677  ORF Transcript_11087/g.27677 Transcript_11087/m.27677 type:complete len:209 (-) Transcript_11087:1560-2186(-)